MTTTEALFSYGPLILTIAGLVGAQYFKKTPLVGTTPTNLVNVVALLDAVDDLSLALMRDPAHVGLADSTKTALLEAVSVKTLVRKEVSAAR